MAKRAAPVLVRSLIKAKHADMHNHNYKDLKANPDDGVRGAKRRRPISTLHVQSVRVWDREREDTTFVKCGEHQNQPRHPDGLPAL